MPKKQKSKSNNNREKNNASATISKPPSDDTVFACVELALKPPVRQSNSNNGTTSPPSQAEVKNSDNNHVFIHWSDAHKIDIRDGEPALVLRHVVPSLEMQRGNNSNNDKVLAAICNVCISPASPYFSNGRSTPSKRGGTPLASKKKSNQVAVAASSGDAILASDSLYDYFLSQSTTDTDTAATGAKTASSTTNAHHVPKSTPQASTPNTASSFTSPSKSKFSFSKGGGGDTLISPSPSKYSSPSGSKFSFAKGGGGDSVLTPPSSGQTTRAILSATPPNTQSKKCTSKVHLVPLINLSSQVLRRLCPNASKLVLCPLKKDESKCKLTTNSSSITTTAASARIIQSLVSSKYQNTFINNAQSVSQKKEQSTTTTILEKGKVDRIISIPFRGQTEKFHVIKATSIQKDDVDDLSDLFHHLVITSGSAGGQHDNEQVSSEEAELMKLVKSLLQGQRRNGKASSTNAVAYRITPQTRVEIIDSLDEVQCTQPILSTNNNESQDNRNTKQAVCAGLDATHARIKDVLLPPLLHPNLFPADGPLRPPKGALLYGPAGVGKSLLAAQIAHDLRYFQGGDTKVHVRLVQCADILSSTTVVGEAEKLLTNIFDEAERQAKSVGGGSLVILDDVHLICPRRGGSGGLGVDQLAGTLLALLDGIGSSKTRADREEEALSGGLVVLAITTDPSLLDPALRRPGRLDVEVEVPVPDDEARAEILTFHLSRVMTKNEIGEAGIKDLARLAKGFTGADCKLAVKEAVRTSITCTASTGAIEFSDLEHAIRITKPSAIKSVAVEVPKVPWSAIGGMESVKAMLKESIELPLTHPHLFEMMQVPPPKGILLYGPPGCSKTLMARAIATSFSMNFLAVKGPELLSKWLGESERALASLFRRARLAAPAVIFFDEMDAIASKRGDGGGGGGDRLLSQLLTELDGVTSGGSAGGKSGRVVVVGATNRPDVLDPVSQTGSSIMYLLRVMAQLKCLFANLSLLFIGFNSPR